MIMIYNLPREGVIMTRMEDHITQTSNSPIGSSGEFNFQILKSPVRKNHNLLEFDGKHYHHLLPHEMEEIVWNMMH